MKSRCSYFLLAFLLFVSVKFSWCQNTPQSVLEELITTEKTEVGEAHYTAPVRHLLEGLKEGDRAQTSQKLLVSRWLRNHHLTLHKNDDGSGWDLVSAQGQKLSTFSITDTYFSGTNALVHLQSKPAQGQGEEGTSYFISMRLQEGDWQVTGFGSWRPTSLESDEFVRHFTPTGDNEAAAQATLGEICSALLNYHGTYPQVGYPSTLQALSGPAEKEQDQKVEGLEVEGQPDAQMNQVPVPQYARMLDPSFLEDPPVKNGYKFHYVLIDSGNADDPQGRFRITATPVEFGKTGDRSFFMDQSGQMRFTAEDRDANENDPLLSGSSTFFSEGGFGGRYTRWIN